MSDIGCFYNHIEAGPCKIISIEKGKTNVEFFHSPVHKETVEVYKKEIKRLQLFEETRVYVEYEDGWRMGRVIMFYKNSDGTFDYNIQFPNQQFRKLSEKEIYTRCWYEHDDPTASLANGCMETQFWHDRRQKLTETFAKQIKGCRGLTSLISSNIELIPHQIYVARRILGDPLQRYLLADEVGMGKTIEAGLIIRQFLTDHPQGNVLVISPNTLLRQWETELEKKFLAFSEHPDRVFVLPIEEVENLPVTEFELLVVDEAHNCVKQSIPNEIETLAKNTPRVLLLSATPALGDVQVLLNLLRLLDPDNYKDISLEKLTERIERSQEIGIFLRGLRTQVTNEDEEILLRRRLNRLSTLFPEDSEVNILGEKAMNALESNNHEMLKLSTNQLRFHIADVYRIHHRLIRNRRKDAESWVFMNRGPDFEEGEPEDFGGHVSIRHTKDSRFESFFDIFEQLLIDLCERGLEESEAVKQFGDTVKSSFEAISSGLDNSETILKNDLISQEFKESFVEIINEINTETSRADQVAAILLECRREIRVEPGMDVKICIFGSNKNDLINSAESLKNSPRVLTDSVKLAWEFDAVENIANTVRHDPGIDFLFCSREEEEGLNLDFCNVLIHLDLPFDPSRLEQRIGRLDRYGRTSMVNQWVVLPFLDSSNTNLWQVWLEVLSKGFKIFNESITDVQLSLDILMEKLVFSLMQRSEALRGSIPMVIESLEKERKKIDAQYTLDQVLQEEDSENSIFEELDDVDAEEEEISEAIHGWMAECLRFKYKGDRNGMYQIEWDRKRKPLLPIGPWAEDFQAPFSLTYTNQRHNLNMLNRNHDDIVQLIRVGCPLLTTILKEYSWDDRGTAFATWRTYKSLNGPEWIGFKLCYKVSKWDEIITTDQGEHLLTMEEEFAFETKLDSYLLPWTEVIYLDEQLRVVEDATYRTLLSQPYNPGGVGYVDYNLGNDKKPLFEFMPRDIFEEKCYLIREESERWLREQPSFKKTILNLLGRAKIDISKKTKRLRQKQKNASSEAKSDIEREIQINKLVLEVVDKPQIKLDAIGATILSNKNPQEFLEEV